MIRSRGLAILFALLSFLVASQTYAGGCPAEYSKEQCEQAGDETDSPPGGGGGGTCTYYLCTNSVPDVRAFYVWCEASVQYTNCPTTACYYRACSGNSCTVDTTKPCNTCPANPGSNVRVTDCPHT